MLFQNHYYLFVKYVQLSMLVDDFNSQRPHGSEYDDAPVKEFLESLDVDVLRIMATIQCIGVRTDDTFDEQDDALSTYLYYLNEEEQIDTKENYISCLLVTSWEWGTAYTFSLGLDRLGIELEGVPTAREMYEKKEYFSPCLMGYMPLDYFEFREALHTLNISDLQFFSDIKCNDMAKRALLNTILRLVGKLTNLL